MRRRWMLGMLATAAMVVTPVSALAQEPTGTPAESGAVAVNVADLVVVSQTRTHNGSGGSDATVVAVFGETVVGGQQDGTGSSSGEVVATGDTGSGSATVGGWSTTVDDQGRSDASASVLHVNLGGDSGGDIEVLGSSSSADHDRSHASSYGVRMAGQGHELYLLRSDADTAGSASTALVDIDGNVIVPNEATREICALAPEGLLTLACVYAEVAQVDLDGDGVPDGAEATAGVVDGAVVDQLGLDLVQAGGVVASSNGDFVAPGVQPPAAPAGPVAPAAPNGPLPRTGLPIFGLLAAGLTALGAGDALRRRR